MITTELISQQEDKRKLPDGWRWMKLADVCDRITDGTHQPPPFTSSGVPFLFVRNIVTGRIDFNVNQFVSQETYEELTRRCRPMRGDLLFSAVGSFGVAVVIETDRPFTFQRHIALIKPKREQIYPYFLAHYLNSPNGRQQSEIAALGVAQRTVTLKSLSNFEIPLPPLDEQKRIAAILDEQMEAVERSRQATLAQLEAAKALPAAYLRAVFNSPEAQKWEQANIGSISTLVIDGPHVTPFYLPSGIPFLTVRNIVNRRIDLSNVSYVSESDHAEFCRRGKAERGDILYTKDGTLGIPCVVDTDLEFSFFVSVALIKLIKSRVNPYFVAFALESPFVLKQVKQLGAGVGLKHMVLKSIRVLKIPLPSLPEQQRIVTTLSEQMAEVQCLQDSLKSQLDAINKLPVTLLRRAFNGEL